MRPLKFSHYGSPLLKSLLVFRFPVILLFVVFLSEEGIAQRVLTLGECYEMAEQAAPIQSEKMAFGEIGKLKDFNLSRGWLPTLDLQGQFVYHSSVMDLAEVMGSLPVPGIGQFISRMPHEQYKLTLEVNQMIYDGGSVRGARAVERAGLEVQEKQTEADLYKLRSLVNGYFFSLLLLDRQKELLENYHALIGKRISSLEAAFESGVVLSSDIDVLTSEKISLEQQLAEIEIGQLTLRKILSGVTGVTIDGSMVLVTPVIREVTAAEPDRPELQLFDLKKKQLDVSRQLLTSRKLPRAFGFASLGYGNPPGNNFLKDEFAPFYMVGAGIRWNIHDWGMIRNEKEMVTLQQSVLEGRKEELADQLKRAVDAKQGEISGLQALLERYGQLVDLRKKISATAEAKYANGTITATEYLSELNAEKQVVINWEIHRITLILAQVEYLTLMGIEPE